MAFPKSSGLLAKSKHFFNPFSRVFSKHKKRPSASRDPEEHANNDAGHHGDQTARPGSLPSAANIAADQPCESTHATSQRAVDTTVRARNVENEDSSSTTSECPAETVTACLWQVAFNELEDSEKTSITKHLSPSSNEIQRDELLRIVKEKEAEYKGRSVVITVDDKDLTWSAYGPVVISHLVTIGEIAIKFAPSPASPIWSAFKVLLSTHASQCQDLVAIFECTKKVSPIIARATMYENRFHEATTTEPIRKLREAIIEVYKEAMRLLAYAGSYIQQNGAQRFMEALLNPGKGKDLFKNLSEAEERLDRGVQDCNLVLNEDMMSLLEKFNAPLQSIHDKTVKMYERGEEKDIIEALEFISRVPFGTQHEDRRERRAEGTCKWLLEHSEFRNWEASSPSSLLWLEGSLGAGKSILTSQVIDHCKDRHDARHGLAYFYLSKSDNKGEENPYTRALQSFVRQLVTNPEEPDMLHAGLVQQCKRLGIQKASFNSEFCEEKISEIVGHLQETMIIVDALDEVPTDCMRKIVAFLSAVAQQSSKPVKVFLSSRGENDIRHQIHKSWSKQGYKHIAIDKHNHADIEEFVSQEIHSIEDGFIREIGQLRWDILKKKIKSTICQKAYGTCGMFILANLMVKQLIPSANAVYNEVGVENRLKQLPETLTAAYDELYDAIEPEYQQYLQRAVKWVKYGHRPLLTEELLSLVQLSREVAAPDDQFVVDDVNLVKANLVTICRHLIVNTWGYWKFPHASVEEYFVDHGNERAKDWMHSNALVELAELSVFLLKSYKWTKQEDDKTGLRNYVMIYWVQHVKEVQSTSHAFERIAMALKPFMIVEDGTYQSSLSYRHWIEEVRHLDYLSYDPHHRISVYEDEVLPAWGYEDDFPPHFGDFEPDDNPAFGIVALGLFPMTKYWGQDFLDLGKVNGNGLDLLSFAARCGKSEVCESLITLGSDINRILFDVGPRSERFKASPSSALAEAVFHKRTTCVKTLLDLGADPNVATSPPILCIATLNDKFDQEIFSLLLRHNANPDVVVIRQHDEGEEYDSENHYECALAAAAATNCTDAVDRLIFEAKATVDLMIIDQKRQIQKTPLAIAAIAGSLDGVERLIFHGAQVNINLEADNHGGVLAAAFCSWNPHTLIPYLINGVKANPHRLVSDLVARHPVPYWPVMALNRQRTAIYLLENRLLNLADLLRLAEVRYKDRSYFGKYFSDEFITSLRDLHKEPPAAHPALIVQIRDNFCR